MDWLVRHGERYLKPETRTTNWLLSYKKAKVHYEPLGVVAAIVSWNYRTHDLYLALTPTEEKLLALHNAFSPILAAIFAGNGIVVKCSENVIWSTQWYVAAIKECLRTCGQDPELVQVHLRTQPAGGSPADLYL